VDADYKVSLDIFEGPLDLLLYLIKKDEIDIYDISIDRITKQYLEYMETFKMLNIDLASEFIVMAANLMYIKSRTLLPRHQQPPDEEAEEEDPRWELIRQLIEYKKFKDAAGYLHVKAEEQASLFPHVPEVFEDEQSGEAPPLADMGIFDLIRAFQNVLDRFEEEHSLGEIVDDRFTVSDKIDHLLSTVAPGGSVRFSDVFSEAKTKGEVIVTFLAVLELMKLSYFRITQDGLLGEIELFRNEHL
jgi:segregation and condensation protein A